MYHILFKIIKLRKRKVLLVEIKLAVAHKVTDLVKPWLGKSNKTYFLLHNAGLFSCASVAMQEIVKKEYTKISARFGMRLYKKFLFSNPWNFYFKKYSSWVSISESPLKLENWHPINWWAEDYSLLPFRSTDLIVKKYFNPSQRVLIKKKELVTKYMIDTSQTIGVHYRGTDKFQEIDLTPLKIYAKVLTELLGLNPTFKVLIQTDDFKAQKFFRDMFGERSIVIDELKTTVGKVGMHYMTSRNPKQSTINYFASVLILSECKYLVTHTGNGALWEVLYRGNSENVTQL
jgi:hypothetical protein